MVKFSLGDSQCSDERWKCICITKNAKKSGHTLVINPVNRKHVLYCVGQAGLCGIAWASVFLADKHPMLSKWRAPIVAACYTGSSLLKEYEKQHKDD